MAPVLRAATATLFLLFSAFFVRTAFADDIVREDEIKDFQGSIVFICGDQAVANQYLVSGRYVTYSADSPPHSSRYSVTSASTSFEPSCPGDSAVDLTLSPVPAYQVGQVLRLYSPDTTPPTISSLTASSITQTSATITWTTNESATHTVKYGTSSGSYDSYPNSKSAGSGASASGAL